MIKHRRGANVQQQLREKECQGMGQQKKWGTPRHNLGAAKN